MDFFETIETRRSIRRFQKQPVPPETIESILKCVRLAPTAGNLQAFEIVVVEDKETKRAIAKASLGQRHVEHAPVLMVFFEHRTRSQIKYGDRGRTLYATQDATIACTYAHLAATAHGLGSCWTGAFNEDRIQALLDAPKGVVPVALLSMGFPDEEPPPVGRLNVKDFVRWVK